MGGFAPPKQFRGSGNLRAVLESNWRYLTTYLNTRENAWTEWDLNPSNITVGNATYSGVYRREGTLVIARFKFTAGSTTTMGNVQFDFPVPPDTTWHEQHVTHVGEASVRQDGSSTFLGRCAYQSSLKFDIDTFDIAHSSGYPRVNSVTASIPFTWAAGDYIYGTLLYEAA